MAEQNTDRIENDSLDIKSSPMISQAISSVERREEADDI